MLCVPLIRRQIITQFERDHIINREHEEKKTNKQQRDEKKLKKKRKRKVGHELYFKLRKLLLFYPLLQATV